MFAFDECVEDQSVVSDLEICVFRTLKLAGYSKNKIDELFGTDYNDFPNQVKCVILYEILKEQKYKSQRLNR